MRRQPHKEYANILKKYLNNFGLELIDISYLSGVNEKTLNALLKGRGGIELGSLDAISSIFNMKYFELGDPETKIPIYENLPEKTKVRISYRKNKGSHKKTSNKKLELTEKIIVILSRYSIDKEFLSKDIVGKVFEYYDNQISTGQVNSRLKGSRLKDYIHQTNNIYKGGPGPNSTYYRLSKNIPNQIIIEAEQKVGVGKWTGK